MPTNETSTENKLTEIAECTSRYSGLILNQLDMAFPKSESRDLVRRAILNALGERGLLAEIRGILSDRTSKTESMETRTSNTAPDSVAVFTKTTPASKSL